MRTMTRNRRVFYEASLTGVSMGQDTDGNYTEEKATYSDPVRHEAVITPASGEAYVQVFGADERYDNVITLNYGENYLEVGSVLWVDTPIELDANGHLKTDTNGNVITPYNYVIVRVAKPLNFVQVAIRKVKVS